MPTAAAVSASSTTLWTRSTRTGMADEGFLHPLLQQRGVRTARYLQNLHSHRGIS